jgi:predicted alpha/beta-fold hydrolase
MKADAEKNMSQFQRDAEKKASEAKAEAMKKIDQFDAVVEKKAAEAKSGLSSWFGGK